MSHHGNQSWSPLTLLVIALAACPAGAQTIADYSRAQRAVLENTMTQAAARSAGVAAAAPAVASAVASVAAGPGLAVSHVAPPAVPPAVQVSGVFASSLGSVAEVMVNATAYVLGAGQGVPGTAWRVESVAIDRVVLSRREARAVVGDAEGARKVFALPAAR